MGRPKGSKNKPKSVATAGAAAVGTDIKTKAKEGPLGHVSHVSHVGRAPKAIKKMSLSERAKTKAKTIKKAWAKKKAKAKAKKWSGAHGLNLHAYVGFPICLAFADREVEGVVVDVTKGVRGAVTMYVKNSDWLVRVMVSQVQGYVVSAEVENKVFGNPLKNQEAKTVTLARALCAKSELNADGLDYLDPLAGVEGFSGVDADDDEGDSDSVAVTSNRLALA